MKRKDVEELHTKDMGELKAILKEVRDSLFKAMMDQKMFKLKDLRSIFRLRKDIARILTIINKKGVDK